MGKFKFELVKEIHASVSPFASEYESELETSTSRSSLYRRCEYISPLAPVGKTTEETGWLMQDNKSCLPTIDALLRNSAFLEVLKKNVLAKFGSRSPEYIAHKATLEKLHVDVARFGGLGQYNRIQLLALLEELQKKRASLSSRFTDIEKLPNDSEEIRKLKKAARKLLDLENRIAYALEELAKNQVKDSDMPLLWHLLSQSSYNLTRPEIDRVWASSVTEFTETEQGEVWKPICELQDSNYQTQTVSESPAEKQYKEMKEDVRLLVVSGLESLPQANGSILEALKAQVEASLGGKHNRCYVFSKEKLFYYDGQEMHEANKKILPQEFDGLKGRLGIAIDPQEKNRSFELVTVKANVADKELISEIASRHNGEDPKEAAKKIVLIKRDSKYYVYSEENGLKEVDSGGTGIISTFFPTLWGNPGVLITETLSGQRLAELNAKLKEYPSISEAIELALSARPSPFFMTDKERLVSQAVLDIAKTTGCVPAMD